MLAPLVWGVRVFFVWASRYVVVRVALQQMEKDMMLWLDRFPRSFAKGASPLSLLPEYDVWLIVSAIFDG